MAMRVPPRHAGGAGADSVALDRTSMDLPFVLLGASTAVFAQATAQVLREQDGRYLDERDLADN